MLIFVTNVTNLLAMSISLWMAFYLFARGYPNRITLRVVLALFAIAIFFLDTYNHIQSTSSETENLRMALLVIALACWYSTTFALLTPQKQDRYRWVEFGIYALGAVSIALLVTAANGSIRTSEDILFTVKLEGNFVNVLYGATQILGAAGILFNLAAQQRVRHTNEGKYIFLASLFLVLALGYGILSLIIESRFPRVIEDGLVFVGIFLLGISVARHQSLMERRTIWQDFPIAMFGMFVIVFFYLAICVLLDVPQRLLGYIIALVITSHCMYDLGREAVERWRRTEENRFRRKPNPPQIYGDEETLRSYLDMELNLLLQVLNSAAGLIAIRQNNKLTVAATSCSLPINSYLSDVLESNEGAFRMEGAIPELAWGSQAFEGMEPVVLVAIGPSNTKLEYSAGDLEILDEFTEQIGTQISISRLRKSKVQSTNDSISKNLNSSPGTDWIKMVDDGLRHFADTVSLGQSPLADWIHIGDGSHIERGKQLQALLREAIQSLRPEGERPPEPLPREWYNHVVLHDAYIKGVPNREVIARLYVSEGTFHRIRRHAVRGVARYLAEKKLIE
ncbi:MAG: hypothetical protein J0M11_19000 [Anaerolineae bacterium]|nr:hypothetical protein [Anaerolineae bacterium]